MNQMMKQKFLNQYQQTSVETGMENATPYKLVSMLYDGIMDNLALGKGAMQRKDYQLKAEKLNKAVLIVGSLRSGLDMKNGGEASENYEALYNYIHRKLLEEVSGLVRELREAWELMPDNFKHASRAQIETIKKIKN